MKKVILTSLIVMMAASTTWALESIDGKKLTGSHFTLNIIGVQNPKTADMDSEKGNGSVIFVNLSGKTKINLICSNEVDAIDDDEFAVLDKNGTDGDGALFALPDPDLDPYWIEDPEFDPESVDTMSAYSIYVRPLGKPFGQATITTCAELINESALFGMLPNSDQKEIKNEMDDVAYCSVQQVGTDITFRDKGKTSFTNVTAELLTIVFEIELIDIIDSEEVVVETYHVRVPIFDDMIQGEYWDYENDGLKHLQVRIYPWGTDVRYADEEYLN